MFTKGVAVWLIASLVIVHTIGVHSVPLKREDGQLRNERQWEFLLEAIPEIAEGLAEGKGVGEALGEGLGKGVIENGIENGIKAIASAATHIA